MSVFRSGILLLCALLGACASKTLKVTYHSDPPGASLFQGGQLMGYTPVTLTYPVNEQARGAGAMQLNGTAVRWASGAAASVPSLKADLGQFGFNQQFTFQRPDVPGRELDIQVALKLQELAILQQQTRALQDQAYYQFMQSIQPPRQPTYCNSTVVGNTVQTHCY